MKKITERHVQAIWYDKRLRPAQLVTRDGVPIDVLSPGEWNLEEGPDFKNAILQIGSNRMIGDVEVHICPSDWDIHGHGTDDNYRNVIAHVTWRDGVPPKSLPATAESIWLGRFFSENKSLPLERIDIESYPYQHISSAKDTSYDAEELISSGKERLRLKAERLNGRLCAAPGCARQVFYEEIMVALGYKRNSVQFRRIAERVPVEYLPGEHDAARNALLIAGSFENWDRRGCRPRNTPEHRLAGAAAVFTTTPILELMNVSDFSERGCRAMTTIMCGEHCMGRGRAAAILANVIVPFAMAEGRLRDIPKWLPPEDVSNPVRLMAYKLFGRDHNPTTLYARNGVCIQGLLHMYHEYCQSIATLTRSVSPSTDSSTDGDIAAQIPRCPALM